MANIRINKILSLLIEITYLGVVFFITLYFALITKNNSVFELNKIVLFKILALFLFLFTFIKLIISVSERQELKNKLKEKNVIIYLLIPFIYILTLLISTIFSVNPENSLFGLYSRYMGHISYLFYCLFFLLLLINIKSKRQIRRIVFAVVASSFVASHYGLIQAAGFDPFNWIESTRARITSTFGQPNFFASYLLLVIPLGAYLFHTTKNFYLKLFSLITIGFNLLCLFFTYSRAGWMGLIGGLISVLFIFIIIRKGGIFKTIFKRYRMLILAAFFLICTLFVGLYNINKQFRHRLDSLASLSGGSLELRKDFWQASLDSLKERLWLGYGLENQGEVLIKYYEKDWAIYSRVNSHPNRAHNLFLDILLTGGIIGLSTYLALLYLFFRICIINIKKGSRLSWAILAGTVSYLISLLFGFSVVATEIYFSFYLALVFIIYIRDNQNKQTDENIKTETEKSGVFKKAVIILAIIIVSAAVLYQSYREVNKLVADYYLREIRQAQADNEHFKSYVLYGYLKDTGTKEKYYDQYFGETLANYMEGFNQLSLTKPGEDILENILSNLNSQSYEDTYVRAKIYMALANEENSGYFALAEENFYKLIAISPQMPKYYRELGRLYYKMGDYDNAIKNYNNALNNIPLTYDFFINQKDWDKYPQFHKYPYFNSDQWRAIAYEKYLIFMGLAEVNIKKENYNQAIDYYLLARKHNRNDNYIYSRIADIYIADKDYGAAIRSFSRGESLEPWNYYWNLRLAKIFISENEADEALAFLEKAEKLNPESEEIKRLLKEINIEKNGR